VLRLVKGWVLAMLVPPVKNGRPCAWLRSRRADKRGAFDQVGRVRQAARLRKQEKFTALLHHVSVETLSVAFYALKRKAAPGVDGVTWQDYEADLERKLPLALRDVQIVSGRGGRPDILTRARRAASNKGLGQEPLQDVRASDA
jgi:hypothetical protein